MINQDKAENEKAKKNINPADHLVELLNSPRSLVSSSAVLLFLNLRLIRTQTISTNGIKKNKDDSFSSHRLLSNMASYPASAGFPAAEL